MINMLENSLTIEEAVIAVNNEHDEGNNKAALLVCSHIIADAIKTRTWLNVERIETALDSFLEHGARFNYSRAYEEMTTDLILVVFNEQVRAIHNDEVKLKQHLQTGTQK